MKTYRRSHADPLKWYESANQRIRPEGMTRREWRSLGATQRKAIILGWADPKVRNVKP